MFRRQSVKLTSREKDGMKGSNNCARRYTKPAAVLMTIAQEGLSSLKSFQNWASYIKKKNNKVG